MNKNYEEKLFLKMKELQEESGIDILLLMGNLNVFGNKYRIFCMVDTEIINLPFKAKCNALISIIKHLFFTKKEYTHE